MAKQKKNAVKKSGANGAKKAAPKSTAANDAALTLRLGPSKKIVRWVDNPRKGASTKIAVLECGHGRALREGPRQSFRCNQCRMEKASGVKVLSRFQKAGLAAKKAVKKSAAKSAPKRATKPPVKAAKPAKKTAAPKKAAAPVARVAVPEAASDERLSA